MRRLVGAAAGALLLVLFVCWRLWTPIDGARRVLPGAVSTPLGVALLSLFTLGVFVWLVARRAPASGAALGAGVALVAGGAFAALAPAVALLPWGLALVERGARALGPRVLPVAAVAPLAALLVAPRGAPGWLGLVVARLPVDAAGAPLYAGAATLVAAACAPLLRRDLRSLAGAAVALLGLALGHALVALLALVALAADGLAAIAEGDPRVARALAILGVVAVAAVGCAVTLTVGPRATPRHDALVVAFFAWSASMWGLAALAAAEPRWRRLLCVAVALLALCDAWFAAAPRLDGQFARPPRQLTR